jgi:hypothetical protein
MAIAYGANINNQTPLVIYVSSTATSLNVNTNYQQTVLLPYSIQKIGRILTITDATGSANLRPITISTQATNLFDNGNSTFTLSNAFQSLTFLSKNPTTWAQTGSVNPILYNSTLTYTNFQVYQDIIAYGNIYAQGGISSPTISSLQGLVSNSNISFISTLTGNSNYFSTGISQIVANATGLTVAGYISASLINTVIAAVQSNAGLGTLITANLTSTVNGLGSAGYVSSIALQQTSNYYRNTLQNWSTAISSVAIYASNSSNFFRNTSNYFKNYTLLDISTAIISTGRIVGTGTTGGQGGSTLSSLFLGANASQNTLRFWGKQGEYNTTVIAEQSTGTTSGELVLFKGSTTADQLRFQTTGRMLFETGAPQRNFSNAITLATPTLILTAACNVGILTANPTFTLDVGGTGRFQTLLSTPAMYAGSLTVGALSMGIFFA